MAVTGDLFKGFTFGSISSKDYDVYITQESAYDAPERDVEFIDIAGRNGAYVLDKGRFLNIQVSYRCGIVGISDSTAQTSESRFREKVRSFRNAPRKLDTSVWKTTTILIFSEKLHFLTESMSRWQTGKLANLL